MYFSDSRSGCFYVFPSVLAQILSLHARDCVQPAFKRPDVPACDWPQAELTVPQLIHADDCHTLE